MSVSRRWTLMRGSVAMAWTGPRLANGERVEVMPVAEHEADLQRVSEEYALQRAHLIDSLTRCTCPIGWGHVVAEDCPRCNPKPRHTVSGASV